MKPATLVFATMLAFSGSLSHAQTLVERLYILRADTTTMDPYSGMTHICVLLYPDGQYRMERSFQGTGGGAPDTKVYLDTLPDPDLKAILAAVDNENFQQIKTNPPRGGIVQDMDTLDIGVPRQHSMQNINFVNAAERKPFEKDLKPFLTSLKNLEKRKVPVAKGEKSTNCEPPRVMYRTMVQSGATQPSTSSDDH